MSFDTNQYQIYWKKMEELNNFTDINNENTTSYGSFYNNAYTNSQTIMNAVLGRKTDPLNLNDIKDFNKILLNKAFGTTDKETDEAEKAQGYFLGQGIVSLFYSQISRYFLNDWEAFVKKITNSIQNIKIDGNTLEKKRKKNTKENIQVEEVYLILKENIIKEINDNLNSLQKQDDVFELDTVDRSSGQTNIKINGSSSSILSVNGRFKEKQLKTVAETIYNQFSYFLDSKKPSNGSQAWEIAKNFYINKKERIKEEMKQALAAYNISILTKNLFLGFWGETWTGIFQSIALDAKSEQVGANKKSQESKSGKILKQTPTDVIIETNDGKKYRIQSKQWANSSLLHGAGEKKKKIGERELAYFGKGGANFQYFYDKDTFEMVRYLIKYGHGDNKYKLEERPDMFAHLSLGSFNLDTFLEYANEDVKGNDFFSFRGKIVPSVYLVKEFFNLLQKEIKKNKKNNTKELVDISAKRKNIMGEFFGEPEYFKVKIKGISVNMKNF